MLYYNLHGHEVLLEQSLVWRLCMITYIGNSYVTGPRFVAVLLHGIKSTRALAQVLLPCNETATDRGHVT